MSKNNILKCFNEMKNKFAHLERLLCSNNSARKKEKV